jgi:hypothetical protein
MHAWFRSIVTSLAGGRRWPEPHADVGFAACQQQFRSFYDDNVDRYRTRTLFVFDRLTCEVVVLLLFSVLCVQNSRLLLQLPVFVASLTSCSSRRATTRSSSAITNECRRRAASVRTTASRVRDTARCDCKATHHRMQLNLYAYNYHENTGVIVDGLCTLLFHPVLSLSSLSFRFCLSRANAVVLCSLSRCNTTFDMTLTSTWH